MMTRIPASLLLAVIAAVSSVAVARAASPAANDVEVGQDAFIPVWDGLVPGASTARNVVALYGKGLFLDELGDAGLRAYRSVDGRTTFTFVFGTDDVLMSIHMIRGAKLPYGATQPPVSSLRKVVPNPAGWIAGLLGRGVGEVRSELGEPDPKLSTPTELWYPNPTNQTSGGSVVFRCESGVVIEIDLIGNGGC